MTRIISILMVEDEMADVLFYKELLTEGHYYHFMITDVPRASRARDMIRSQAFDVVLLDLNLVDTKGIETIEAIAPAAEANGIPVIVLSSSDNRELAMKSVLTGAVNYMVKGQDDAHLISNIIHHTIDRYKRMQSYA